MICGEEVRFFRALLHNGMGDDENFGSCSQIVRKKSDFFGFGSIIV